MPIFIPKKPEVWLEKPYDRSEIDYSNEFSQYLLGCILPGAEGGRDLVADAFYDKVGGAYNEESGSLRGSFVFDGSNDYVELGGDDKWLPSQISYYTSFKRSNTGSYQALVFGTARDGSSVTSNQGLELNPSGQLYLTAGQTSNSWAQVGGKTIASDTVYHAACSVDDVKVRAYFRDDGSSWNDVLEANIGARNYDYSKAQRIGNSAHYGNHFGGEVGALIAFTNSDESFLDSYIENPYQVVKARRKYWMLSDAVAESNLEVTQGNNTLSAKGLESGHLATTHGDKGLSAAGSIEAAPQVAYEKILDTTHALYGNITRALTSDTPLDYMRALKGGTDTASQPTNKARHSGIGNPFTAVQGIVKQFDYWIAIDNDGIRKYDLSGTLIASNLTPFSNCPTAADRLNDGFVYGGLFYMPVHKTVGDPDVTTEQAIMMYDVSDLSFDSAFDVSAQANSQGTGACISQDNAEIWTTGFRNDAGTHSKKHDLHRFDIDTGAFLGVHVLDTDVDGMQGLVIHKDLLYISSHGSPEQSVFVFDLDFKYYGTIEDTGTTEMEGVASYDGNLYFHDVFKSPRLLETDGMYIGLSASQSSTKVLLQSEVPDTSTMLIKAKFSSIAGASKNVWDNPNLTSDWESWTYATGEVNYALTAGEKVISNAGSIVDGQEHLIAYSWDKDGANVDIKVGVDGAYHASGTGAWTAPPVDGIWLNASHVNHARNEVTYYEVILLDKVLSDAELLDASTNFDTFFTNEIMSTFNPAWAMASKRSNVIGAR